MSSVFPSPLAPAALTLTKDDDGTLSYWGLERSKTLRPSRRVLGLAGAVNDPETDVLVADAAALAQVEADADPSPPVV